MTQFNVEDLHLASMKYFLEKAKKHREDPLKCSIFCTNGILNAAILIETYVTWFILARVESNDEDDFFGRRPGFKAKWEYAYKHYRDDPDIPIIPAFDDPELESIRNTMDIRNTIVHYKAGSVVVVSEKQLELAIQSVNELQNILSRWYELFRKRCNNYTAS